MKRVLFIAARDDLYGASRALLAQMARLPAHGFERIALATPEDGPLAAAARAIGAEVIVEPSVGAGRSLIGRAVALFRLRRVARFAEARGIELVAAATLSACPAAVAVARGCGARSVVHLRSTYVSRGKGDAFVRYGAQRADRVIAVSRAVLAEYSDVSGAVLAEHTSSGGVPTSSSGAVLAEHTSSGGVLTSSSGAVLAEHTSSGGVLTSSSGAVLAEHTSSGGVLTSSSGGVLTSSSGGVLTSSSGAVLAVSSDAVLAASSGAVNKESSSGAALAEHTSSGAVLAESSSYSGAVLGKYTCPSGQSAFVVHDGIEPVAVLAREEARRVLGLASDARVAGIVGSVSRRKGSGFAARVAARAGIMLAVLGEGEDDFGGVPVVRFGFRADAARLLAAFDVLLFPSRDEAFGLAPLEAMAAGVPVIASNIGGIPEALGDAAVLLPPADEDAWVAAVDRVSADRDAWIARGRARARLMSADESARRLAEVYRAP